MRLETLPLIAAVVVALVGVALIVDAKLPDYSVLPLERRRAPRIGRHRGGEGLVGVGILALAAALAGRDGWRYSILAAMIGAALVLWGALLNRRFLVAMVSHRGALRRREPGVVLPRAGRVTPPGRTPAPPEGRPRPTPPGDSPRAPR